MLLMFPRKGLSCCSDSENELLKPLLFLISLIANVLMTHIDL